MTQQTCARASGFLFLWLIVTGVAGMVITSHVLGGGTLAEKTQRVGASEHLYRFGLTTELVETLSALLLAFTLYVTLRAVDELLARLAMLWRIAEALVGCIGVIFGFARLGLYTTSQSQPLIDLTRYAGNASFAIGVTCFSFGSLLFFRLFLRSGYIPRWLAILGVVASPIVTVIGLGSLLMPERSATLQYGWIPMAIAEVVTGVWLLAKGATAQVDAPP